MKHLLLHVDRSSPKEESDRGMVLRQVTGDELGLGGLPSIDEHGTHQLEGGLGHDDMINVGLPSSTV